MNKKVILISLFIASLLPLFSLLQPGLPVTHDGPDHVARIANFYQALKEGIIIPRWAANLNWGYGHPILMFLYPLPSYLASFFKSFGLSFVDSTKLVFGVAYVASLFTMFLWLDVQFGSIAGFAGALLYGFAPYRFVDLYVRGALGEHMAFVFPPIILYGLLRLSGRKEMRETSSDVLFITLGLSGLILAHNAISLMFVPLIGLYILYLAVFQAKKRHQFIVLSFVSCLLGFVLSSFFWVPAFFEGKYTLRDIVTAGEITNRFVAWRDFFFTPWSYGGSSDLSKELGLVQWVGVLGALAVFLKREKTSLKWIVGWSLVLLFISLFFMTDGAASVWNNVSLLQKFQFPWRVLSVTTFLSAFLGAYTVSLLPKRYTLWVAAGLVIVLLFTTAHMWKANGYILKNDMFYTSIYNGTTDTGESSPIWSIRFMEHRPIAPLEIIDGSAKVKERMRTSTRHTYTVSASLQTSMLENTLYFPGWTIFVDGKATTIEYQNPQYRGLMTFQVPAGEHTVVVSFENTKLRTVANMISIAGVALLFGLFIFIKKYV